MGSCKREQSQGKKEKKKKRKRKTPHLVFVLHILPITPSLRTFLRLIDGAAKKESKKKKAAKEKGFFDNLAVKQVGRTAANVITRSFLGALGLGGRTTRRKKSGWF